MSGRGVGVDYHHFYHFLEGLADYRNWHGKVDFHTKHLRLKQQESAWIKRKKVSLVFEQVLDHFKASTLVVSYRSDGIPSPKELAAMMGRVKKHVEVRTLASSYKYVLSKNDASTREILIIGRD